MLGLTAHFVDHYDDVYRLAFEDGQNQANQNLLECMAEVILGYIGIVSGNIGVKWG